MVNKKTLELAAKSWMQVINFPLTFVSIWEAAILDPCWAVFHAAGSC